MTYLGPRRGYHEANVLMNSLQTQLFWVMKLRETKEDSIRAVVGVDAGSNTTTPHCRSIFQTQKGALFILKLVYSYARINNNSAKMVMLQVALVSMLLEAVLMLAMCLMTCFGKFYTLLGVGY